VGIAYLTIKGERMKKKKEKWYIWSKLSKGELANEYDKLKTKFTKVQADLDFANEQVNVWKTDFLDLKQENLKLSAKIKEEEGYTLRSKVHLLEKLVALHEQKPKDEIRYVNGVVTTTSSTSPIPTSSTTFTR
tara:strand:- start:82 stop:480 length:399 start_codon:yes stop_codon:yes gene_type:complete